MRILRPLLPLMTIMILLPLSACTTLTEAGQSSAGEATPTTNQAGTTQASDSDAAARSAVPKVSSSSNATAPPTPDAPEARQEPIASRTAAFDGINFRMDLFPLERQGRSIVINARLTALQVPPGDEMHRGRLVVSPTHQTNDPNYEIDSGFSLSDATTAYLPARDGQTDLCTKTRNSGWVQGDVHWVSCVFAGVPEPTKELSLRAQTFGGFAHVPVR